MKKTITFLATLLITVATFAQSPQQMMSYQAVIRNSSDALVANQVVGMRISILETTVTGTAVYVETQTPTTNANGLVTLAIGTGTPVTGFYEGGINWANGPYFIKTETDPAGGTNYTITGTSQLMSVPYALHAITAEFLTNPLYKGNSSTSLTISSFGDCSFQWPGCANGTASIVTDTELAYSAGMRIRLSATIDPVNNIIEGVVSSYDGSNMEIAVDWTRVIWNQGSGSFSSWNINLGAGIPGVPGAIGDRGPGGFYSRGNLISINNDDYTVTDSFIYNGLNNYQSIQKAYVRASSAPGTTYDIRLYDIDNNIAIAEITGQSNNNPAIIDLGYIQDFYPYNLKSIEIQVRRSSGTGQVRIYSVLVE